MNCPLTEFSFPPQFNCLREFIISFYLFEVNRRQQQCGLLFTKSRNKIRMVQWQQPNIPYCSSHCWTSHRAGWKMCVGTSVGQTTSQSKNMLTYIEFGPCSECCLTPWNIASREVGKLLCQRQGEVSHFPLQREEGIATSDETRSTRDYFLWDSEHGRSVHRQLKDTQINPMQN